MSVELDPPELGFKRPFQQEVTQTLKLRNTHSDPVAFKVKTTAPKQYCVRPNSGRIEPGDHVEVQILLQAMKEDPPPDAKCRDKFLVQSVLVTADKEFTNVASLWSNIEQTAKSSIQEKKIRVIFLPSDDAVATPKSNGATNPRESILSSPAVEASTPQQFPASQSVDSIRSAPRSSESKSSLRDSTATAASTVAATVGSAVAGVADVIPTSSAELQAQLAEAKATITNLRQQLDSGLRQRKNEPARDSKEQLQTAVAPQQTPGGVPVHITALVALLSFLLAYFLF